jgi:hypothetical protein
VPGLAHLANLCQSITDRQCRINSCSGVDFALVGQVLILGGSNQFRDWLHNLQAWSAPSPTGPGTVHAGHLALARAAWPTIRDLAKSQRRPIRHLVGYSMGGALALLMGERLRDVQITTFAAPAVGSVEWARRYPHPVTRCTVEPDLVARPWFGRHHVGAHAVKRGGSNPICNHLNTLALWGRA